MSYTTEPIEPMPRKSGASSPHTDPKIQVVEAFDYQQLDSATADTLRRAVDEIRACRLDVGRRIIRIGEKLHAVKARLAHGQFGGWLEAEFGWSDRTARNFMQVAEVFREKSEIVSDLPASLMYKLAAPSTPVHIRETVISQLESGQRIDCRAITTGINASRPRRLNSSRCIDEAVREAKVILAKLSASDRERLIQIFSTPGLRAHLKEANHRTAEEIKRADAPELPASLDRRRPKPCEACDGEGCPTCRP